MAGTQFREAQTFRVRAQHAAHYATESSHQLVAIVADLSSAHNMRKLWINGARYTYANRLSLWCWKPFNYLNSNDAQAWLEYAGRGICCGGYLLVSVVYSAHQWWQRVACPLIDVIALWLMQSSSASSIIPNRMVFDSVLCWDAWPNHGSFECPMVDDKPLTFMGLFFMFTKSEIVCSLTAVHFRVTDGTKLFEGAGCEVLFALPYRPISPHFWSQLNSKTVSQQ